MAKIILPKKPAVSAKDISISSKKTQTPLPTMAKLKANSNRLNRLTDVAADTVKEVEKFLTTECSIGFNAHIKVKEIHGTSISRYLEYTRIGSHYRIAVVESYTTDGEVVSEKAWSDCSREIKMETIVKLPELIQKITDKVESDISQAEAAEVSVIKALSLLAEIEG